MHWPPTLRSESMTWHLISSRPSSNHLEEADGTGAHDDGIGFNELIGGLGNGHIVFNSHDSVSNG